MVVGGHAGVLQLARLLVVQLTEGHADFHAELAHFAHGLEHGLETPIPRTNTFPGRTHAKTRRSVRLGGVRMREDFLRAHERLGFEIRVVVRALRAITAILAACAGLDAQQRAKLHLASGPMPLVGAASLRDEIEKRAIVDFLELRERLFHCAGA